MAILNILRLLRCGKCHKPLDASSVSPEEAGPNCQTSARNGSKAPKLSTSNTDQSVIRWTKYKAIFTGALVVASVLQFCTMRAQQDVMQGQLNEMRDQESLTHLQLKANFRFINLDVRADNSNGIVTNWEINPEWINSGGSEASDFTGWWAPNIVKGRAPMKSDCNPPQQPADLIPAIISGGQNTLLMTKMISNDDMVKALAKRETILASGLIEWKDWFSQTVVHHFKWCKLVVPANLATGSFYVEDAGDEKD